jgi:hypothetical protein
MQAERVKRGAKQTAAKGEIADHNVDRVRLACRSSRIPLSQWNVVQSSSLGIPSSFRGQDRIIEIARRLGARTYVKPGGRNLYDHDAFARAGIELRFLSDYSGPNASRDQDGAIGEGKSAA